MSEVAVTANAAATASPKAAESADVVAQQAEGTDAKAKPAVEEDPELDFGEFKVKKSEAAKALAKRRELDRGAFAKFEEAKKIRDEVTAEREALKKDPWSVLKKHGIDPDKAAYERLQRLVQEQEMPPEQRQLMEERAKIEQERAEIEKWRSEQETQKQQAELQAFEQETMKQIVPALEKSGLPKHPFSLALMNQHAMGQLRAGAENPDWEIAAEQAKDFSEEFARSWLASLVSNPKALVEKFPEVAKAIREHDLASVRKAPAPSGKPAAPAKAPKKPASIDPDDVFRPFMLGGASR